MALEVVYASSHITGAFLNPNNAIGNTPSTWAGELNVNTNYTSRWAIAEPVNNNFEPLTQTIRVYARKGTNSGNPTIGINIYENGTLLQTGTAQTVTSTTGQVITDTFSSTLVSNPNALEIEVVQTSAGGNPNTRNSAQIAYIEASLETVAPVAPPAPTLTLDSYGETFANLTSSVLDADTYEFQRNSVTVQNTTSRTLNDTGLTPGTLYTYRVRGISSGLLGEWSNEQSITTPQTVQKSASDTLSVTTIETVAFGTVAVGSTDSISITVAETTDVALSGLVTINSSDTLSVAVAETSDIVSSEDFGTETQDLLWSTDFTTGRDSYTPEVEEGASNLSFPSPAHALDTNVMRHAMHSGQRLGYQARTRFHQTAGGSSVTEFTTVTPRFAIDSNVTGWESGTGSTGTPDTITFETSNVYAGAGALRISRTMATDTTDWMRARSPWQAHPVDWRGNGNAIGAKVFIPEDAQGTWSARVEVQATAGTVSSGNLQSLSKGAWVGISHTFTDAELTDVARVVVWIQCFGGNGSQYALVDEVHQGTEETIANGGLGIDPQTEIYMTYQVYLPSGLDLEKDLKFPGLGGLPDAEGGWYTSTGGDMKADSWSARLHARPSTLYSVGYPWWDAYLYAWYANGQAYGGQWALQIPFSDGLNGAGSRLPIPRDRWFEVKHRLKMNTPGVNDGIYEGWIDGVKGVSLTDVQWRQSGYDTPINQLILQTLYNDPGPTASGDIDFARVQLWSSDPADAAEVIQKSSSDTLSVSVTESASAETSGPSEWAVVATDVTDEFIDTDIQHGQTIEYELRAYNDAGTSEWTLVTVEVPEPTLLEPSSTDGLNVTLTETSDLYIEITEVEQSAVDLVAVNIIETSAVEVSGLVEKTSSDTLNVSIGESVSGHAEPDTNDVLSVGLAESSSIAVSGLVEKTAGDTIDASVIDSANVDNLSDWTLKAEGITNEFIDTDVQPGQTWEYELQAYDETGESEWVSTTITIPEEGFVEKSATDTLNVQIVADSETAISGLLEKSSTDTLTVAVDETTDQFVELSSTDSLTVEVEETTDVAISGLLEKSSADDINVGLVETVDQHVYLDAQDNLDVVTDESANIAISGLVEKTASDVLHVEISTTVGQFQSLAWSDQLSVTLEESSAVAVSGLVEKSSSDTLAVGLDESVDFAPIELASADTLDVRVAEFADLWVGGGVQQTATDELSVSVAETSDIEVMLVTVTADDTLSITVDESANFAPVQVDASDTLDVEFSEAAENWLAWSGTDDLSVGFTENTDLEIGGFVAKASADTLSVTIGEQVGTGGQIAAADALTVAIEETSDVQISGAVVIESTDNLAVAITESTARAVYLHSTDSLTVTIDETPNVKLNRQSADTLEVTVAEEHSTAIAGLVEVYSTDTLSVTVQGQAFLGSSPIQSVEQLAVTLTEKSRVRKVSPAQFRDITIAYTVPVARVEIGEPRSRTDFEAGLPQLRPRVTINAPTTGRLIIGEAQTLGAEFNQPVLRPRAEIGLPQNLPSVTIETAQTRTTIGEPVIDR